MTAEALRRVGRPDQQASEELLRHIRDTATALFIRQGYAATSIEQIATAAGSGKQTIYRRFASKEALFIEVINRQGERLTELARKAHTTGGSPLEGLEQIGRLLLDFVLQPDLLGLQRVLIAETTRFPELGDMVLERCMGPFQGLVMAALQAAEDAGQIHFADLEQTQLQMFGILAGGVMHKSLIGQGPLQTAADRDAYFASAWEIFLHGVA